MKKILITGGAGYIGSHTAVALVNSGFEPVIVDNFSNSEKSALDGIKSILGREIVYHEVDCLDKIGMEKVFQDNDFLGVIHFAASKAVGESTRLPLKYYSNNIDSLIILLELMSKYKVKDLVFSSSCTVYGQPKVLPVTEATPRQDAESPYGNTKKICEDILRDLILSGAESRIVALRYFNPVGAHPSAAIGELPIGVPANLIPYITQTAAGIREKITVFGNDYDTADGTCVRDYIHVMDLADAHVKALKFLSEQKDNFYDIFNVGTGNGNTVLEVIETFEKVSGQKLNYEIGPRRSGDIEKVWANTDKINKVLGWEAKYSLEDSIRDSWNWQMKLGKK